jgi:hypothetical protein
MKNGRNSCGFRHGNRQFLKYNFIIVSVEESAAWGGEFGVTGKEGTKDRSLVYSSTQKRGAAYSLQVLVSMCQTRICHVSTDMTSRSTCYAILTDLICGYFSCVSAF